MNRHFTYISIGSEYLNVSVEENSEHKILHNFANYNSKSSCKWGAICWKFVCFKWTHQNQKVSEVCTRLHCDLRKISAFYLLRTAALSYDVEMNARLEVSEAMQGKLDNCPLELEVSDNLYYKALLLKLQITRENKAPSADSHCLPCKNPTKHWSD